MRAGCEKDAHERPPVGRGLDLTFIFRRRAMLQQGGDWHDEEAAGKTQQRKQQVRFIYVGLRSRQQCGKDRQAKRPQRHEAVFDFTAGKIARRQTAQTDAQRERDVQQADMGLGDL